MVDAGGLNLGAGRQSVVDWGETVKAELFSVERCLVRRGPA